MLLPTLFNMRTMLPRRASVATASAATTVKMPAGLVVNTPLVESMPLSESGSAGPHGGAPPVTEAHTSRIRAASCSTDLAAEGDGANVVKNAAISAALG